MMLAFLLLCLATLAASWTVADRATCKIGSPEAWGLGWLEGLTRFFLLWIGAGWFLATCRWLHPVGYMGVAILAVFLSAGLCRKHPVALRNNLRRALEALRSLRTEWAFIGILGLLLAFNFFKGWLLPCANTDALAWSMPISIRYHLSHGLTWSTPPQAEWLPHLSDPHNYELIVTSILSLTGSDRITEWVSTFAAGGILSVVGIQFRRWSGPGLHNWTALLLFAATPVFLLHMAADKGDLLVILLVLLGIFWTVRTWLEGGLKPGLLALWVLLALFNTKKSGWILAPPLLLVVGIRWTALSVSGRIPRVPTLLRTSAHFLVATVLMGGVKALWLWHHAPSIRQGVAQAASQLNPSIHSFSWADPFRFLWVVSLAPFRSSDYTIRLLSGTEWYWPEYNLMYSHYGWMFGPELLLTAGLLAAGMFRRGPAMRFSREQWLTLVISATLAYLLLARNYAYDGGFNTFPRFVLFLLPPLLATGVVPALLIAGRTRAFGMAAALVLAGSAGMAYTRDMTAPLVYMEDLWKHPDKRRWVLVGPNRMPCILDRLAGPRAVVVADCTYLTWLAPLWGEGFTRDVRIIPWKAGKPSIPPDAEWVVIDNVSGQMWGNGLQVRNAEDFAKAFRHGVPSARDSRLFAQLKGDPAWEVVLASPLGEQALLRRAVPHMGALSGGN